MNKQNRVLLGLFFGLTFLALTLEKPWQGDAHAKTFAQVNPLFPELLTQRQQISRIEISSGGETCSLLRNAAGFAIAEKFNHPAATSKVVALVDDLSRLDDRDVVSTNSESHAKYGVADGQGTRIKVFAGDYLLADMIGGALRKQDIHSGKVALEFYVRRVDKNDVCLVSSYSPPPTAPEDWLRVSLCSIEVTDIQTAERVDFIGSGSWRMSRGEEPESWNLHQDPTQLADSFNAESWVFSFANLEASDVVAEMGSQTRPSPEYGFTADLFRVIDHDGNASELQLGRAAPGNRRFAWVPGGNWVYAIDEFEADQLRMDIPIHSEDQAED